MDTALIALLLAGASPMPAAQAVIERTLVAAHSDAHRQSQDRFASATVDRSIIGQRFSLSYPFGDGQQRQVGGSGSSGWFAYSNGQMKLIFTAESQSFGENNIGRPYIAVAHFRTRRISDRSYGGQNAFGATARVSSHLMEQDGLAFVTAPNLTTRDDEQGRRLVELTREIRGDAAAEAMIESLRGPPRYRYEVNLLMAPEDARRLSRDARFVIEGEVTDILDGRLTHCSGMYGAPTIRNPTEIALSRCWLGANIRKVLFIDSRNGTVLQEWVLEPENR